MRRFITFCGLLFVALAITPQSYHITFNGDADEIHLVIHSADGTAPYFALQVVDVQAGVEAVDLMREKLPAGAYVLQAESWRWEDTPGGAELLPYDESETLIIKVR